MKRVIIIAIAAILTLIPSSYACRRAKHKLNIVTYNVGVFHKSGSNSIEMVSSMMREAGADVLSLNELDSCTLRTGKEYQLDSLAKKMGGWNYRYASAIDYRGGRYGVGIAARSGLDILDFQKFFLPMEESKEQRVLAIAEFKDFVLATTHLDYSSDRDQLTQAEKVTELIKSHYGNCRKPVFLCGDMNASPESSTMREYQKAWTILSELSPTISSRRPHLCIDYIMLLNGSAECRVTETSVMQDFKSGDVTVASDHLPVRVCVEWK